MRGTISSKNNNKKEVGNDIFLCVCNPPPFPHLCLQVFEAPYTTSFAMDSFAAAKAALDAAANE